MTFQGAASSLRLAPTTSSTGCHSLRRLTGPVLQAGHVESLPTMPLTRRA
jgi:hypothetical protein